MKIGVLGTGVVGRALAGRLAELDHEVVVGTRSPDETQGREEWDIPLATFADAAQGADVVINATRGDITLDVLGTIGDSLNGTVLLDVSNPIDMETGFPPQLFVKDTDSLAERIQAAFPGARVVKSLNTLGAPMMVHPEALPEPTTVFISGDDDDAKFVVTGLLEELGHDDVIDLGELSTARGTEMYLAFWLRVFGALGTPQFNVKIVRWPAEPTE